MQNIKMFEQNFLRFLEIQAENDKSLTAFSFNANHVKTAIWQQMVGEIKNKSTNGILPEQKRLLNKHNPLLEEMIENAESVSQMVADIKHIHAYQQQLIELLNSVIEENNQKAYTLYEAMKALNIEGQENIKAPITTIDQYYAQFV